MLEIPSAGWYRLKKYIPYFKDAEAALWIGAFIIVLVNLDIIVIPALKFYGIDGVKLFSIASVIATLELLYQFLFWRFFIEQILHKPHSRFQGMRMFFLKKYQQATNERSHLVRFLKFGGRTTLFFAAASPEPFGRLVSVVFCSLTKSWRAFYIVALGDIIHVASIIYGWDVIFSLFHIH